MGFKTNPLNKVIEGTENLIKTIMKLKKKDLNFDIDE